jgi:hypothetical protein
MKKIEVKKSKGEQIFGAEAMNSPEDVSFLNEQKRRLNQAAYKNLADNLYQVQFFKPGDKPGQGEYILTEEVKAKMPEFVSKLLEKDHITKTVEKRIKEEKDILKTLFRNQERGLFEDKNFDFWMNNIDAREIETNKNQEEVIKRVEKDPEAYPDELMIGAYKEVLESQVRDAVIALAHKGYSSFESGFESAVEGSQYMGFNKDSTKGRIEVPTELVENLKQEYGVTLSVANKLDRDQLLLTPSIPPDSKPIDINVWKKIWDKVADKLPVIGLPVENRRTGFSRDFIVQQEKVKKGENVYLGYGVAYLDKKPQKMTRNEFEARASAKS